MSSDKKSRLDNIFAIRAAPAIFLGGALPANARDWEDYSATSSGLSDAHFSDGPFNPDDEAGWKALAKNNDLTTKTPTLKTDTGHHGPAGAGRI
jgi:hypothetical protein